MVFNLVIDISLTYPWPFQYIKPNPGADHSLCQACFNSVLQVGNGHGYAELNPLAVKYVVFEFLDEVCGVRKLADNCLSKKFKRAIEKLTFKIVYPTFDGKIFVQSS